MLTAIEEPKDLRRALDKMEQMLRGRGESYQRTVRNKDEVVWMKEERFWSCLDRGKTDYWYYFGLDNPESLKRGDHMKKFIVQINPPLKGVNKNKGGIFARGETGKVHLCHTGTIKGGKTAFWERYRGNSKEVSIPNRETPIQVVDLGPVTNERLPTRIACFVREVARIKKEIKKRTKKKSKKGHSDADSGEYTEEFSGNRSGYSSKNPIEPVVIHGCVVDALKEALTKAGHKKIRNNKKRDLFIIHQGREKKRRGARVTLFEVKTDISSTSIYQGVGQLMMNGRARERQTNLILVVPEEPTSETESGLKKLGIDVLSYKWSGSKPKFTNLHEVMS